MSLAGMSLSEKHCLTGLSTEYRDLGQDLVVGGQCGGRWGVSSDTSALTEAEDKQSSLLYCDVIAQHGFTVSLS